MNSQLAAWMIKSLLCAGLMYGYYMLALKDKRFHRYNRFYLLGTVLISLSLPFLRLEWFRFRSDDQATLGLLRLYSGESSIVIGSRSSVSPQTISLYVLAGIALVLLIIALVRVITIFRLARRNHPRRVDGIDLVECDLPDAPFSFFNYLFWKRGQNITDEAGQRVLRHELTHIREHHTWDKLLVGISCALCWVNPFLWLVRRELAMVHEFIADEQAVGAEGGSALAAMLLQASLTSGSSFPVNPFFYSPIKRRLAMIMHSGSPRHSYLRRLMALPVLALALIVLSIHVEAKAKKLLLLKAVDADTVSRDRIYNLNPAYNSVKTGDSKDTRVYNLNPTSEEPRTDLNRADTTPSVTVQGRDGSTARLTIKPSSDKIKGLIILDGKEFHGDLNTISPSDISQVTVFKGRDAVDKYGEAARDGVIEITTKGTDQAHFVPPLILQNVVEHSALFPGGNDEWRKYLEKNLNRDLPARRGAKPGNYTSVVSFLVDERGRLSDFRIVKDGGYGTGEETVRVIARGPDWVPASDHGQPVLYRQQQAITFQVAE